MITADCHQMYNIIIEFIHPTAHKGGEVDRGRLCADMCRCSRYSTVCLRRRNRCRYQQCKPLNIMQAPLEKTHKPFWGTLNAPDWPSTGYGFQVEPMGTSRLKWAWERGTDWGIVTWTSGSARSNAFNPSMHNMAQKWPDWVFIFISSRSLCIEGFMFSGSRSRRLCSSFALQQEVEPGKEKYEPQSEQIPPSGKTCTIKNVRETPAEIVHIWPFSSQVWFFLHVILSPIGREKW